MIPIATEDFFKTYWLPLAKSLELSWVQMFETGVIIISESLPIVLNELKLMTEFVSGKPSPNIPKWALDHMIDRMNLLVSELNSTKNSNNLSIYIG
ncbi:hypothetical protein [Hanamia caeni]|nr:hypothetical protein [Hanamia caeni]